MSYILFFDIGTAEHDTVYTVLLKICYKITYVLHSSPIFSFGVTPIIGTIHSVRKVTVLR